MRSGLRENIAGLRPIRGLLVAVAVSRCSVMLYPFYAAYLAVTRQGLSAGAIGLVIGTFGIGALLADMSSGALTARVQNQSASAGTAGSARREGGDEAQASEETSSANDAADERRMGFSLAIGQRLEAGRPG